MPGLRNTWADYAPSLEKHQKERLVPGLAYSSELYLARSSLWSENSAGWFGLYWID